MNAVMLRVEIDFNKSELSNGLAANQWLTRSKRWLQQALD